LVEKDLDFKGFKIRLMDTAGLREIKIDEIQGEREEQRIIERIGIERSVRA
jgi:tRNA U34 5-carboxymethylaminomethyl modifying GTPase MnmE/TrmE